MPLRIPSLVIALSLRLLATGVDASERDQTEFDVQGHRGARGLLPENTLPAFSRALELGVTTLEMDLQMTRDGVLVVHHDKRLNSKLCQRLDGDRVGNRLLAELDYSEIESLDCGSRRARGFPAQVLTPGARIPRLEEALDLAAAAHYPVWVSLEIKQPMDKLPLSLEEVVDRIVSMLMSRGLESRGIVQSKWGAVLQVVRERAPSLERALVVRTARAHHWVEEGVATIVSRKHVYLDRAEVEAMQALGARVIPWTVNKPARMERLQEWGVNGLITDYPDRAMEMLGAGDEEPQ